MYLKFLINLNTDIISISEGSSDNGNGGHDSGGVECHGGALSAGRDGELEGICVLGLIEEDGVVGSWIAVVIGGNVAPGLGAPVFTKVGFTLLTGWIFDVPGIAVASVIFWQSGIGEERRWWHSVLLSFEAFAGGSDRGDGEDSKGRFHLLILKVIN